MAQSTGERWVLDGQAQLKDLWERTRPLCKEHAPDQEVEGERLLEAGETIRVTVFGTYSSGKSTLVNALLGRSVAKTGVTPTTDQTTEYSWEGAVLVDTPGTAASPEETEDALKAVERSHVLVCVIPGFGKQEEAGNWENLRRAVERAGGRLIPTIFVLHDFAGEVFNTQPSGVLDAITTEHTRVLQGLVREFEIPYKIVHCNAAAYLEALDAGAAPEGLEESFIPHLRRSIIGYAQRKGATLELLRALRKLLGVQESTRARVRQKLAAATEEGQRRAAAEAQLDAMQRSLELSLEDVSKSLDEKLETSLFKGLRNRTDGQVLEKRVQDILAEFSGPMLEQAFDEVSTRLSTDLEQLAGGSVAPGQLRVPIHQELLSLQSIPIPVWASVGKQMVPAMTTVISGLAGPKVAAMVGARALSVLGVLGGPVGFLATAVIQVASWFFGGGGGGESVEEVHAAEEEAQDLADRITKEFRKDRIAAIRGAVQDLRGKLDEEFSLTGEAEALRSADAHLGALADEARDGMIYLEGGIADAGGE